ncbi:MAG: AAA family ATPase [Deltaproteobacteria bacterium]
MKKIGLKNFRRFETFNLLEYSGITFLVGRNNSGKSTVVKALLLLDNYFKSGDIKSFSFGNNILEDANIVTFSRAKYNKTKENLIVFTICIENFYFDVTISGEDNDTYARVNELRIWDWATYFDFTFTPQIQAVTITKNFNDIKADEKDDLLLDFDKEINNLNNLISKSKLKKTSKEYIDLLDNLNNLKNKRNQIVHGIYPIDNDADSNVSESGEDIEILPLTESISSYSFTTHYPEGKNLKEIINFAIEEAIDLHGVEFNKSQQGLETVEEFEDYRGIKQEKSELETSFNDFYDLTHNNTLTYLGANAIKQSALFAIRDKNNALAQAINEFKQLNIERGEEEHRFVMKWMKEFEVGDDFTIVMHAGEAYELKIKSGDFEIQLADKGMGSIQAMLLIMRMACAIRKKNLQEKKSASTNYLDGKESKQLSYYYNHINKTTIIIEEPELNLHPALQSKLADLFLLVHEEHKIDFIIETHSEYVLRRSQVLVAENELEIFPNSNPFCVHYFPKEMDQIPYQLKYQPDGTFDKNFGTGFFDTASLDTLKLLRIKREKKA